MKKNTFFLAGLPVIALALGMMVAGCDDGSSGDDSAKQIKITGLPANTAEVTITLSNGVDDNPDDPSDPYIVAAKGSTKEILENSATVSLKKTGSGEGFTARGFHIVSLKIELTGSTESLYRMYTDGVPLKDLNFAETDDANEIYSKIPKYHIVSALSTIAYDKFVE